jgi:hypothetical protein
LFWGVGAADVTCVASCEASSVSNVFERSIVTESSTPQRTREREAVGEAEGVDGVKDAVVLFVAEPCNDTVHVAVGVSIDCEVLTVGACVSSMVALWEQEGDGDPRDRVPLGGDDEFVKDCVTVLAD